MNNKRNSLQQQPPAFSHTRIAPSAVAGRYVVSEMADSKSATKANFMAHKDSGRTLAILKTRAQRLKSR